MVYSSNSFPWYDNLKSGWKWRLKLKPGDDIIKSLEQFALDITNHTDPSISSLVLGFAEFRLIGSVWANSVKYAISEAFGDVRNVPREFSNPSVYTSFGDGENSRENKKLEILCCSGTISWENPNKPKAHGHIIFADSDAERKGNAFGGHLLEAKVSIVAEIIVDVLTTSKDILGDKNWDMSSYSTRVKGKKEDERQR